ncbi:MAG: HIT family protein [Candidatus Woesearchaeota archaeon]
MSEDCIFCKIVRGEAPSTKVYEDDDFIAIQSLFQSVKGHTLLIPKEHSEDITQMKPELGQKMLELIQKVGKAQMRGLGADGFNVAVNTKREAGQVIDHTHIHLLPRFKDDGMKLWKEHEVDEEDRVLYAEKIINGME